MSSVSTNVWSQSGRTAILASERKGVSGKTVIFLAIFFLFSAGLYLSSINKNAVHGYQVRTLERDIANLKKENDALRIREADARSLEKTKEASARMGMERSTEVKIVERGGSVALNR